MNYFDRHPDGKKMLAQFKALWRSMTKDERESWTLWVLFSKDKHMAPLKAFLKWRENAGHDQF